MPNGDPRGRIFYPTLKYDKFLHSQQDQVWGLLIQLT